MNIFVARLSFDTDSDGLRHAFEAFGEVESAKVIMDYETGKSRGFGFVEMPDEGQGLAAIEALNEKELDGNEIVVKKAEPRGNSRDRRGGGGGGGGYDRGGRGGGGYGGGGGGYDRGGRGGGGYGGGGGGRGGYDRGGGGGGGRGGYDRGGGGRGGYDRGGGGGYDRNDRGSSYDRRRSSYDDNYSSKRSRSNDDNYNRNWNDNNDNNDNNDDY